MTNEQKVTEIMLKHMPYTDPTVNTIVRDALQEMAEWKDHQFAEEKKLLIEKACNYIYNNAYVTTFHDIRLDKCSITQFVDIFKKAMEQ